MVMKNNNILMIEDEHIPNQQLAALLEFKSSKFYKVKQYFDGEE